MTPSFGKTKNYTPTSPLPWNFINFSTKTSLLRWKVLECWAITSTWGLLATPFLFEVVKKKRKKFAASLKLIRIQFQ